VIETLACVTWARGLAERLPPWDAGGDRETVLAAARAEGGQLRPHLELDQACELVLFWHRRARIEQIHRLRLPLPPLPGKTLYEREYEHAEILAGGGLLHLIEGDYPAFGKPFSRISDAELERMLLITASRHRAFNWLAGRSSDWDKLPDEI
jgi:hypothetical protein